MELFLPSLFVIVIAALFAFFIIPRTGSLILAITSLIALIVAGVHHYNLFYAEYARSTWQNGLATNAPIVLLTLAFFFIVGAIYFMFSGGMTQAANAAPIETLQNAGPLTANTIVESIANTVNRGVNAVVPNLNINVNKKNNTGILNNVTSLIPGTNVRASQI